MPSNGTPSGAAQGLAGRTGAGHTAGDRIVGRGAEAVVLAEDWLGRRVVRKVRAARPYRHPALDARLRAERTRDEAALLIAARTAGVPAPAVLDADRAATTLTLEALPGRALGEALRDEGVSDAAAGQLLERLGGLVARMHEAGIAHGDLTASNVLVQDGEVCLIDFGLGQATQQAEDHGVDLHIVEEALESTDARAAQLFASFLAGYGTGAVQAAALRRLDDVRQRGRYR